ncbi:MAG: hypothetical protein IJG36_00475, partial [Synergistaceae bacterium]|nr:hypothetical protein [Synergistaceae bacterium]
MRRVKLFFLCLVMACLFGAFVETSSSEAVTIHNKPLSNIPDIVKEVTGSDFPELQKHSLMLFERFTYQGNEIVYQPRVFTLNNDGTVRKVHELDIQHPTQKYSTTLSPRDDCRQKIDLTLSPKRFGKRRNVVYTNAGLSDYYSITGFQTVDSSGTEDSVSMTTPQEATPQWFLKDRNMWGNAGMTIEGMESQDIFVFAHSSHLSQTGNIYLYFLGVDRNESGAVSSHRINAHTGGGLFVDEGVGLFDYSNGIRAVDITAGDFDGDGWKNEIAVCFNDNNRVYAYFYRASKDGNHTVRVDYLRKEQLLDQHYRASDAMHQASVTALTGDFDGDGQQEAAFVYRYPHHQDFI